MAAATRIYIARLAGVAVFDPNGDPVGRVRDVVVVFRPPPLSPRVLGLVVEIQHRRRIFVPIGRMTSADAEAVSPSALLDKPVAAAKVPTAVLKSLAAML